MKNTLKKRLTAFGISYVVFFIAARIYRNKVILPQLMAQQEIMLEHQIRQGNLKIIS